MGIREKEFIMTKLNNTTKTVVEVMDQLSKKSNMKLGIDTIEFPDGSKSDFVYNGEADRQAAIEFAQTCYNATNNPEDARRMMANCVYLMINNITPNEEVTLSDGEIYYVDLSRKLISNRYGETIAELKEEEQTITDRRAIIAILSERAERALLED